MQQFDLFTSENTGHSTSASVEASSIGNNTRGKRKHLLKDTSEFFDGELQYLPGWLSPQLATKLFNVLHHKLIWRQEQIQVYGKWHTSPRMQAWYGDEEAAYQYSGVMMDPIPWPSELRQLKEACESFCQTRFNSALANLYRDGDDCMGFHSDDEKELGPEPVIASVTLGDARNFDLVHKHQPYKLRLALPAGSILVMRGKTQQNWQHGIARTKQSVSARINLTFRAIRKYSTV